MLEHQPRPQHNFYALRTRLLEQCPPPPPPPPENKRNLVFLIFGIEKRVDYDQIYGQIFKRIQERMRLEIRLYNNHNPIPSQGRVFYRKAGPTTQELKWEGGGGGATQISNVD